MALQGDFVTLPARELFDTLERRRASGRLSVRRGMAARRFHLREGRVMLVSSTEEQSLLGRLLVERGLLDEEQLRGVLATRGGGARLGQTLSERGLVSPADLAGVLAEKAQRLLSDTLDWRDGHFHFDEDPAPDAAAVTAAVDLAELLGRRPRNRPRRPGDTLPVTAADVIDEQPLSGARPRRKRGAAA